MLPAKTQEILCATWQQNSHRFLLPHQGVKVGWWMHVSPRRMHRARNEQYFKSWIWKGPDRSAELLTVNKFLNAKESEPPRSEVIHFSGFIKSSLETMWSLFWYAAKFSWCWFHFQNSEPPKHAVTVVQQHKVSIKTKSKKGGIFLLNIILNPPALRVKTPPYKNTIFYKTQQHKGTHKDITWVRPHLWLARTRPWQQFNVIFGFFCVWFSPEPMCEF